MNPLFNKESAMRVVIASGMIKVAQKGAAYTAGGNVIVARVVDTDPRFSG